MTGNFRKVVFFVLLLGVAVVGYQYMIKPANEHLAEVKGRVDTKFAQLSKFQQATAAAEDLSKQLDQLEEAIGFSKAGCHRKARYTKCLSR